MSTSPTGPNILRRPIHPDPGNATIADAARLHTLYSEFGDTNGAPWTTRYGATTTIQGLRQQIPDLTSDEAATNKPAPDVSQPNKLPSHPRPTGNDDPDVGTGQWFDGSDISLNSEVNSDDPTNKLDPNTKMQLTMLVFAEPSNVPIVGTGIQNSLAVDVGTVLGHFVADQKAHGSEYALRELLRRPCATFGQSLDAAVQRAKDRAIPPAMVEAAFEKLPGVAG